MREIKIDVNMKVKNMYEFLMRHAYVSGAGVASVAFSLLAFAYLCFNYSKVGGVQLVVLIIASLMFTIINPIWIYVTAIKQVKVAPTFKETLTYVLNETGVKVMQGDEELLVEWGEVQKVVETKNNMTIYLSRVRAFVIPKEALGEDRQAVVELIQNAVDTKVCHLKRA